MSAFTLSYTRQVIDPVHLSAYLKSVVGSPPVDNLGYAPSTNVITVYLINVSEANRAATEDSVYSALNAYTNVSSTSLFTPSTGTGQNLKLDVIEPFTASSGSIQILANIDVSGKLVRGSGPPLDPGDLCNRAYVDSIGPGTGLRKVGQIFNIALDPGSLDIDGQNRIRLASASAGTGLLGGGSVPLAVRSDLPHVTSVGQLVNLSVAGLLTATSGIDVDGQRISSLGAPFADTDATSFGFLKATIRKLPGSGLQMTNDVLAVAPDGSSLVIGGDGKLTIAGSFIGTGLVGGIGGVPLSVSTSLPSVVSVGTLNKLSVDGPVTFLSTVDSSSPQSGSIQAKGGLGVLGSVSIGAGLFVTSGINANLQLIRNVADPISAGDASNRRYVDSMVALAGAGLTKTGTTLSVNVDGTSIQIHTDGKLRVASGIAGTGLTGGSGLPLSVNSNQPGIVTLGALTTLNVVGAVSFSAAFTADRISLTNNATIGGTLTVTGSSAFARVTLSSTDDALSLGSGSLILAGGLSVSKSVQLGGTLNMNSQRIVNLVSPLSGNEPATKSYTDSLIVSAGAGLNKSGTIIAAQVDTSSIEVSATNNLRVASGIAGLGLTGGSGVALSVNASQPQITAVGTLSSLNVSGAVTFTSGLNAGGARIVSIGTPTVATDAANKGYTDAYVVAGTGLVKTTTASNATLSVDSAQPGITSLGVLNSLTVTGLVTSPAVPTAAEHLTNKAYVDAKFVFTAGTGLALNGSQLSVNPTLTHVTSVGSLSSLTVTGPASITGNVTASAGPSDPAHLSNKAYVDGYIIAGTGLSKSSGSTSATISVNPAQPQITSVGTLSTLTVSGAATLSTASFTGNVTASTAPSLATHLSNKAYVDAYVLAGTGLTKTTATSNATISVNAAQSGITSLGTLTSLTVGGTTTLAGLSATSGTFTTSFSSAGRVTFSDVSDATSAVSGPVSTSGGISVAKSAYIGGPLYALSSLTVTGVSTLTGNVVCSSQITGTSAVQSTSITTGAAVFAGGIGLSGNLNTGGILAVSSTVPSTSTTTGSGVFSGGVGISGDLYCTNIRMNNSLTDAFSRPIANVYAGYTGQQSITMGNNYSAGNCMEVSYTYVPAGVSYANFGLYSRTGIQVYSDSKVICPFTTQSNDLDSGAMIIKGGLAVVKRTTIGGTLNTQAGRTSAMTAVTAAYTITPTDHHVGCDTTGGPFTVTLPLASDNPGQVIRLFKTTNDYNAVTVAATGTDTITGQTTMVLQMPDAHIALISTLAAGWLVTAYNNFDPSPSTYGYFNPSAAIDGDVVVSSNLTLTRNMYYRNLTVNAGITLRANGWRIIVINLLTLNGTIANDGNDASLNVAGTGSNTAGTTYLGPGSTGAAGTTAAGVGLAGVASTYACTGGTGGSGGQGGNNAGGAAGAYTSMAPVDGGLYVLSHMPTAMMGRTLAGNYYLMGGTGGGSGGATRGSATTIRSGGGGGGGGLVIVACKQLQGTGRISATGGNGGNASFVGGSNPGSTGGGGGGGGGCIICIYQVPLPNTIVLDASGGAGGAPLNAGAIGNPGATGNVFLVKV